MLHAPAVTEDLVLRYERMLERYLDVRLPLVALSPRTRTAADRGPDERAGARPEERQSPEHTAALALVEATGRPVVSADLGQETSAELAPLRREGVAALAAWPLTSTDGSTVGVLCAADQEPRHWTREDLDTLADLAEGCSGELAHRRGRAEAERQAERARELTRRSRVLLALSEELSATRTLDDISYAVERVAVEHLDCLHGGIWLLRRARDASETDRLRHVVDPASRWGSAGRNSDLAVSTANPIGEVLLTGRAAVFADRAEQNARHPHLDLSQQVGETRYLMPLGLGRPFGVLALVWEHEQTLSAEHRVTIATLASYVSQAVQRAELLEERELVSTTLQNAMLPRLPAVPGLSLTARYRPAATHDRVGGDWYDAVVTDAGATDLLIGDVAGHDIAAAAVMGEVRSMLRAFAFGHDHSPSTNVARLDEALERFGIDRFASLLYVRVEAADGTGQRRLRWTNAGHFAPLLVRPDGTAELLDDPQGHDLVVGVDATSERHDRECLVPEGSLLVLYTDGLIERRGECVSSGLSRLRRSATRHHGLAPAEVLDALIADLVGPDNEDDVAVLAVRFTS